MLITCGTDGSSQVSMSMAEYETKAKRIADLEEGLGQIAKLADPKGGPASATDVQILSIAVLCGENRA